MFDFDSGKVESTNHIQQRHSQPKFWEGSISLTSSEQQYLVCLSKHKTTTYVEIWLGPWPLATSLKHNWYFRKPHTYHAHGEFTEFMSFLDKKKLMDQSFHLTIHKLLVFCTTYVWRGICVFSELIIIKSKNRSLLKNVEKHLVLRCLVSIYGWMICIKIIMCIHPISCDW